MATYERSPVRTTYRSGTRLDRLRSISPINLVWKSSHRPKHSMNGSMPGNGDRIWEISKDKEITGPAALFNYIAGHCRLKRKVPQ